MIETIASGIAEGFVAPRRAMRRVLAQRPGPDAVLGLVLLAYLVQAMSAILVPGARGGGDVSPLLTHLNLVISQLVLFTFTSVVVFGVGRLFGGTGTLPQSFAAVAWYSFVTSVLAVPALYGLTSAAEGDPGALASLLLVGASAIGLWVFAGCVAELHGFRSIWGVLGATLGLMLLAVAFLLMLVPAP